MSGNLVFIGDVHLEREDAALGDFLSFLERLAPTTSRIVLMGDLFTVWIGDRRVEQPHQQAVVRKLGELRGRGVVVRYVEGNRDFRIASCYTGVALDEVTEAGLVERFAGISLFAAHGDGIHPADRQYRLWRRFSRSSPVWWLLRAVPAARRARLAEALERRLRATNVEFKSQFPEAVVRSWAARHFAAGHDAVVLGHFHVELDLSVAGQGRILVLPEWKGARRHLQVGPNGSPVFVDSVY